MIRQQKYFFAELLLWETASAAGVEAPSSSASLDRRSRVCRMPAPPIGFSARQTVPDVHRFEESIAGRAYLIEVSAVAKGRWRACIMRRPGVPTALMPFYGSTPDEAARQLSDWLTRA